MRLILPWLPLLSLTACRDHDSGDPPEPQDSAVDFGEVVAGESCPRLELAGAIELSLYEGTVSLGGVVNSAPSPFAGEATLTNEHCAFHPYDAAGCGVCPDPLVCGGDGHCVPVPTAFTDLWVSATAGGVTHVAEGDPTGGWLYEQWAHGGEDWALEVRFGSDGFTVPAMPIASGDIGLGVTVESPQEDAPGALTVGWAPVNDGSIVRTEIPVNHHAQPGTFTLCEASAALGGFTADAAMIDPLAVITGLEFQGVSHLQVASVQTSVGCVELRFGAWVRPDITYGG